MADKCIAFSDSVWKQIEIYAESEDPLAVTFFDMSSKLLKDFSNGNIPKSWLSAPSIVLPLSPADDFVFCFHGDVMRVLSCSGKYLG